MAQCQAITDEIIADNNCVIVHLLLIVHKVKEV